MFATVGFLVVPLLTFDGEWADVVPRIGFGAFLLATAALTLYRLWAANSRRLLADRVLFAAAAVVAALGAVVVTRDLYYVVRFGDIYSGVTYGDPEYYIPVAGSILLCQGLLTIWQLRVSAQGVR